MSPAKAPLKMTGSAICAEAGKLLGSELDDRKLTAALGAVSNLFCFHVAEHATRTVEVRLDGFECVEVATKEQVNVEITRALSGRTKISADRIREALFAALLSAVRTSDGPVAVDGFGRFTATTNPGVLNLSIEHPLSAFLDAQQSRWGADTAATSR